MTTPHFDAAVAKLEALGARRLAEIIVRSLTPAGGTSEWDSETIELVLCEYEEVLKEVGLPWVGNSGPDHEYHKAWAEIARELDYYHDYPFDNEEPDDDGGMGWSTY